MLPKLTSPTRKHVSACGGVRSLRCRLGTNPTCFTKDSGPRQATASGDVCPALKRRSGIAMLPAFALASFLPIAWPSSVLAERGLSRYIRKKQLDPLVTYVPLVLEARNQLAASWALVTQEDDPKAARELLRTGALGSVRDNVRALGEYAVKNGAVSSAGELVTSFFMSLEEYDQKLLAVVKQAAALNTEETRLSLDQAVSALDTLIATVPSADLDKARAILATSNQKGGAGAGLDKDPSLKDLLVGPPA